MSIVPGTRLGPYEITGVIGAGGMGDVYKARDTRLDRSVAIKIVRTAFSERFEREARSISALNHPHICTLYDVGQGAVPAPEEGLTPSLISYLVMELVEGSPISGPLPVADVIRYGTQICEALDAAHKKSIVHRDLKPANILATKGGIKLLDFGLAKLQPGAAKASGEDATVAALTGAHTIIGTPQYMAPEQIEGKEADARTDIFALGCVLYELITGKRAFDGKTASNVMAAVLATEPRKVSELVPVTPPALEWVVTRCLEKDPDARWQSARDVALQLKWVAEQPALAAAAPMAKSWRRGAFLLGAALGGAVCALAIFGWLWSTGGRSGASTGGQQAFSLSADLPPGVELRVEGPRSAITLSPDGRTIAFAGSSSSGDAAIYVRPVDGFDAVRIPGTENGQAPFFSPDGNWIGFVAQGRLRKIPVGGGAAVEICPIASLRGAVWLPDDTIVLSPVPTGGLVRVSSAGGTPVPLTRLDEGQHEKTHRSPTVLPGGKVIVFVIGSNEIGTYDEARIVALDLETSRTTELVKGGYAPAYSPTGHLLYVRDDSVFAQALDPVSLKASGSPVQVLKDVATLPGYGTAEFAVASTGALIYTAGGDRSARGSIHWLSRSGDKGPRFGPEKSFVQVAISRDGRRLGLIESRANNVMWSYDLASGQTTRVTFKLDVEGPTWMSNGAQLSFWGGADLRSISADGNAVEKLVIPSTALAGRRAFPASWSNDDLTLAVNLETPGQLGDIGLYSVPDGRLTTVASTRFDEWGPQFSPDGKWLAFASDRSGRPEVYVQAVQGSDRTYPVSNNGSDTVWWADSGRELVIASEDAVMAVPFSPGSPGQAPVIGKPALLFTSATAAFKNLEWFALAPDGKRFAAIYHNPIPPLTEIRVMTNWLPELARVR